MSLEKKMYTYTYHKHVLRDSSQHDVISFKMGGGVNSKERECREKLMFDFYMNSLCSHGFRYFMIMEKSEC